MSAPRSVLVSALVAGACLTGAVAPAGAAADRTKPSMTEVSITPRTLCRAEAGPSGYAGPRTISLKLSEPAKLKLYSYEILYGFLPAGFQSRSIALQPAGEIEVFTTSGGGAFSPGFWADEDPIVASGRFGIEATDAAGNRSSIKWLSPVKTGDVANGTFGCLTSTVPALAAN